MKKIRRGEAAARFAQEHQVSLAVAARHFKISRERARQKWRDLFGDTPTPTQAAQAERSGMVMTLANGGLTAAEIARELDVPLSSVCVVRDREGISMVKGSNKLAASDELKAEIVRLAQAGRGRAEIARETGANYSTVTNYLRGHSTRGARRASGNRSALASEVMDRTNCSLTEAAAMFEVAPPSVYAYRKRRGLWTTLQ